MNYQIILVFILTFIIYTITTLAYSVRIVGVRTGRIAIAFAVFNVFALVSRTANTIQAPLLAKNIEQSINSGNPDSLLQIFRYILFSATLATIFGAFLMPTFIKIFSKAVVSFSIHRSIPKLLIHSFSKSGIEQFKKSVTIPKRRDLSELKNFRKVPKKVVVMNAVAFSISTVGVLASLYAGYLNPEFRTTCSTLSSIISGFSTILMFIFIDPFISMMTDDVIRGECSMAQFKRCITFVVGGLITGTIMAQFLLVPAARFIGMMARVI